MRLIWRIILRLSAFLFVLLLGWATAFYVVIEDEVRDETDDALEAYSEQLVRKWLAGAQMPTPDNGTNNTYYINELTKEQARQLPGVSYSYKTIYIESKDETEQARTVSRVFRDSSGSWYELTVYIPTMEKSDMREMILLLLVVLYGALLIMIIGIVWWILWRSMRPLYAYIEWLNSYRVGAENKPLDIETKVPEYNKIFEAAKRSAARSEELFEQQKSFIGNLSHELQTPLAVCRNRLEMLLMEETLQEKQANEIHKVLQTIDSTVRMNRSLLLLSKIDNGEFPDLDNVAIGELLNSICDDMADIYEHLNINVSRDIDTSTKLWMSSSLARVLVTNLIKNAFNHNEKDGEVKIQLRGSLLSVWNSSSSEALNADRIFNRFYREDKREGSSGLGLYITAAICKLYGYKIGYNHTKNGHEFTINFSSKLGKK